MNALASTPTEERPKNISIINTIKWKAKTLLNFSYIDSIDKALEVDNFFRSFEEKIYEPDVTLLLLYEEQVTLICPE